MQQLELIDQSGPGWHLAPEPGAVYSALRAARETAHDAFTRYVGQWERSVLACLPPEPPLDRPSAEDFIAALWLRHATNWSPFFISTPALVIVEEPRTAECSWDQHQVIVSADMMRKPVLLHECAHLMVWYDVNHGLAFRETLMALWSAEFGIDPARALKLASEHGL
jgi:hypothetical protein